MGLIKLPTAVFSFVIIGLPISRVGFKAEPGRGSCE